MPGCPRCLSCLRLQALLLAMVVLSGCLAHPFRGPPPDGGRTAVPTPASFPRPVPAFTPTDTPRSTATPTPTPSLTVSGTYDHLAVHADGRYTLQLAGTRVAATFATFGSPVEHWERAMSLPLFTVPVPFRPSYPLLRTVEGRPVHADGTSDPARTSPHRFLLRVDPDGGVHYVDDVRVEGAGRLAYTLHTVWDTAPPPPTPSLTVSGTYDNRVEHADGRYELQLSGARVAATLTVSRSPVQYWAREVAAPLFTVPAPFRPPYPILRTAEGIPVRADGALASDLPEPRRFLLLVDSDGGVHYVNDAHMEDTKYLAYALHTDWGTTPAANDRAVLEILDRHWFGETLLSAEPPPVQFKVPAFEGYEYEGTIPAAMVGAFVTFDADGRVTALGAPSDDRRRTLGAPQYHFNGPLLPELGELHRLEHLDLGYREYDFKPGGPTRRMEVGWILDRGGSVPTDTGALTGAIPPQLWQLSRLHHLDLQGQLLTGPLPSELGRLTSLMHLDLGYNLLTGSLPPAWGQLVNLQTLKLGGNRLAGLLPPEIGHLASLTHLDLGTNQWQGHVIGNRLPVLPPELGRLANLQTLSLGGIRLTALPPELGRLANLQTLNLVMNRLTALPPELGRLANLQTLDLAYNRLIALPPELGRLANLQTLDLAYNQSTGPLPPAWGQLASLERLLLEDNQLTGPLPLEWDQLARLQWLDLRDNQLTGPLPPEWGQLASLQVLSLDDNQLTGSLPPEWGQLASLERLYLDGNRLTGPLPPEWGQLVHLQTLFLHDNQLTGSLPPEWDQFTSLQWLDLRGNQLTGPLPLEWTRMTNLERLRLEDNQLTGCYSKVSPKLTVNTDLPGCPD